jgi:beta-lactamase regulating signal transducer with metallopeptidase domain/protein involved in polysaccharide export with SLBB domain
MNLLVDSTVLTQIGWGLVHSIWQGIVGAMLLGLSLAVIPASKPRLRHDAACLIMVAVAVAVFSTMLWPSQARMNAVQQGNSYVTPAANGQWLGPVVGRENPLGWGQVALKAFAAAWLTGVALLGARHLGSLQQIARWRRNASVETGAARQVVVRLATTIGLRPVPALLTCAQVIGPSVIGFIRPAILMPAAVLSELSPQYLQAIIAHELAHIRRRDAMVNMLQTVIESLLFYHPAVVWMGIVARNEREIACDKEAANLIGSAPVVATALTRLEELLAASATPSAASLLSGARDGSLTTRVRRLLNAPVRARADTGAPRHWVLGTAMVVAAFVVGLRAVASPDTEVGVSSRPSMTPAPGITTRQTRNHTELADGLRGSTTRASRIANPATLPATMQSLNSAYYISGVERGGTYSLSVEHSITLKQALVAAGVTRNTGPKSVTLRRKGEGAPISFLLADLLSGASPNLRIVDGDVIMVADTGAPLGTGLCYIGGSVPRPGAYVVRGQLNLLQALIATGFDPLTNHTFTVQVTRHSASTLTAESNATFRVDELVRGGGTAVMDHDTILVFDPTHPMPELTTRPAP